MRSFKHTGGLLLLLLCPLLLFAKEAPDFKSVYALTKRVVPWLLPSVQYAPLQAPEGRNGFELESSGPKLIIRATDVNSAAMGLNWYLKYYCFRSMSHMADNLGPVSPLPVITQKVHIETPYTLRYALNYCTHNYSMSFYTWKEWEHELDWMALNGVNLMLTITGTEAIWQRTLQRLGYTETDIHAFLPGPAFTAWWLMGNLEGWPGPLSQTLIDQQVQLQQHILQRMQELGIQPVLQGFYGMVPTTLRSKWPQAKIVQQGKWAGGFTRPDVLLATDSLFARAGAIYYQELQKLYGNKIRYFAGDLFHEGGITNGIDVTAVGRAVQQLMQQYFPGATWVLQGWQHNPRKDLLDGLDKQHTLVLELFGEKTSEWESTNAYYGSPWLWGTVSSAGGKSGLYGRLQRFPKEFYRARHSEAGRFLKGTGILPEGIHNNPLTYDLALELPWHEEKLNLADWLRSYVRYRYGQDIPAVQNAWQVFLSTVYDTTLVSQDLGPAESVFCARPAIGLTTVSTWGYRKRYYDTQVFEAAVRTFATAAKTMQHSTTYKTDLVDLTRQVLANRGEAVYDALSRAYNNKDLAAFIKQEQIFLQLMQQQEQLLAGSPYFRLDSWLQAANAMGRNATDKAYLVKNARTQITYWGPDNPATDLHEYACKEWSGMLSTFYIPRWKLFFDYAHRQLKGGTVPAPDYFAFERQWAERPFKPAPLTIKDPLLIALQVLNEDIEN